MRLDKFLSNMGIGTRTEVKQLLKKKHVKIDDKIETSPKKQVDPKSETVKVNEQPIHYIDYVYLMLNKPKGIFQQQKTINKKQFLI